MNFEKEEGREKKKKRSTRKIIIDLWKRKEKKRKEWEKINWNKHPSLFYIWKLRILVIELTVVAHRNATVHGITDERHNYSKKGQEHPILP